jgi:DNA-binding CsgD family transcriptional regulator
MRQLSPDSPAGGPHAGDFLAPRDALQLVELASLVGFARQDPRAWRMELLAGVNRVLAAAASAAFILRLAEPSPSVVSMIDTGFKADEQRSAFSREFQQAPFRDPQAHRAIEHFLGQQLDTFTCLRADMIPDGDWHANVHVLTHRRPTGMGDCLLSLHRATDRSTAYALLVFRTAVSEPPPGAPPGADIVAASRFSTRERLLLDTLHRGIDGIYRAEESARRVTPAAALPPRLRQTLEYLLTGDTERQVALKMSLSVHTVHDYVKALYSHFGVSSRGELLSKWIGTGGQPPATGAKGE